MSGERFVFVVMLICQSKGFFWKFESDLIIIKHVSTKVCVKNAPQTVNKDDDDDAVTAAAAAADDDMRLRAENLKRSKKYDEKCFIGQKLVRQPCCQCQFSQSTRVHGRFSLHEDFKRFKT